MRAKSWTALLVSLAGLLTAGCGSREIRTAKSSLSYVANYERDGKALTASSWISVRTSQIYSLVPRGWAGLNCTVDAAAIEIPANNGFIYVLLPENGFTIGARMRDVHTKLFNLPYADKDGEWVQQWNAFEGSQRSVDLPAEMQPDFLFIPSGANALKARQVTVEQLPDYGIRLERLTLREDRERQRTIPANLQRALNLPTGEGLSRDDPDQFSHRLLVRKAIT